ncbi:NAD-dependent epimerase/dehydratase [Cynara cardunculus var. scolymus]|uniref:Dihydroflavonol 4-reductase n=1 Tax=Cynara cardunculus var. scolymus TaxID=59895 RepID=A0A103XSH4_CYNCS|nr:NAD-dependent epimerase/dehydratase [Cynara cardunculus var. scolymus]
MDHGKVCVTGASGFLASWLIKRLLSAGYHVIGTVRDPGNDSKLAHLWNLQGAKERLRLVKAELTEEGSFDDAILGCEGVFHTASPGEILKPAIDGTLNVLSSCKKNPSLRRVVFTSSSSTLRVRDDFDPKKVTIDESSWSSVEFCERLNIWFEQHDRPYYEFDTTKLKSLGFTFKPIQEMFDDCVTSLVEQGHLSIP